MLLSESYVPVKSGRCHLLYPLVNCQGFLYVYTSPELRLISNLQAHPDLSIIPLDSTTSQFDALPLEPLVMSPSLSVPCVTGISDLASLQAKLTTFHDSVCAMVQKHVTVTSQVL